MGRYSISFRPVSLSPGGQGYVPQSSSRPLNLDERAVSLIPWHFLRSMIDLILSFSLPSQVRFLLLEELLASFSSRCS